ncbi:MAG: nucleoid occlusion factor SlmA [Pseudomonadota bacterium]
MPRPSRRNEILQALAQQLEKNPGDRITTAALAKAAGVSEAALYRHFASKAKILEALIEFAEESVFTRINQILEEDKDTASRCYFIVYLLLGFADRNPGITRLLLGDALTGENERLHARVQQFFQRLETQFRQVLREARLRGEPEYRLPPELAARFLTDWIEGRMHHYRRSRFSESPLLQLEAVWELVAQTLYAPPPHHHSPR